MKITEIVLGAVLFFGALENAAAKVNIIDEIASYQAPKIEGIEKWLNSKPLQISDLKGKVVLIDFWTYSCINCIRTLPYMIDLDKKYRDKGLVIIGVQAPEFEFEKDEKNVAKAVQKFGIKYPVALDNKLITWRNFENQYWPAHYLINQDGRVVYTHFGEGKYDVMENNVRALLGLNEKVAEIKNPFAFFRNQSPETYLGSQRASGNVNDSVEKLVFPKVISQDSWALEGKWQLHSQYIESKAANDSLRYNFKAKKVFLVMASADGKPVKAMIFVDGKKVTNNAGADVVASTVVVKDSRLYELVNMSKNSNGLLEIRASSAGLQAYAFTFGSE